MAAEKLQVGAVVRLNSGGPKMTVTEIGNDVGGRPYVLCRWFDGNKPMEETFTPDALELAKSGPSGTVMA